MPVRLLHEKGIDYYNQWKKLQKDHKNCNDLKDNAERLSGMKKTDHFYPVLQIVIYFGQEQDVYKRQPICCMKYALKPIRIHSMNLKTRLLTKTSCPVKPLCGYD